MFVIAKEKFKGTNLVNFFTLIEADFKKAVKETENVSPPKN